MDKAETRKKLYEILSATRDGEFYLRLGNTDKAYLLDLIANAEDDTIKLMHNAAAEPFEVVE